MHGSCRHKKHIITERLDLMCTHAMKYTHVHGFINGGVEVGMHGADNLGIVKLHATERYIQATRYM